MSMSLKSKEETRERGERGVLESIRGRLLKAVPQNTGIRNKVFKAWTSSSDLISRGAKRE